jgi:hypothetical protein
MHRFEWWLDLIWALAVFGLPAVVVIAAFYLALEFVYKRIRLTYKNVKINKIVREESPMNVSDGLFAQTRECLDGLAKSDPERTEIRDRPFSGDIDWTGSGRRRHDRFFDGESDTPVDEDPR